MKTAHRISALANQLNELQACLGRASGRPSNSVMEAQRIAAELASSLEDWHLETLHIPEPERDLYRAQNPYYAAHCRRALPYQKLTSVGFFLSAKRIKTDNQARSARHEKRVQNHSFEHQSREA